ncbi:MAG: hypothetical protein ABI983_09795 [Acidobacteriota bacterium]
MGDRIVAAPVGLNTMAKRFSSWAFVLLFNAALAAVIAGAAPSQPVLTDRNDYDYNAKRWLTAYCPNSIMCYRILVPALLEFVPVDAEPRWRGYQWLAHTATGAVVAMAAAPIAAPLISSVLLQSSYGFAFTAYDPYSPDPFVFLIAALTLYLWLVDRVLAMTLMAGAGVFAKETVALVASVPAIAVLLSDRMQKWRWFEPAVVAWSLLLFFHWWMDTYAGWSIRQSQSSNFLTGSCLVLSWRNSFGTKMLLLFAPFGFGWVFAALGYRYATPPFRQLALGAVLPIAALAYVQTPERALGNAFFVIVPLAAAFLSRVSPAAAWAAAITNGLVTAKIGLSAPWLPSSSILMFPAALSAVWAIASSRRQST